MEELIKALRRFDSLETVIAELEAFDKRDDLEVTVDDLAEYLNDEADYANYQRKETYGRETFIPRKAER